MKFKFGALFLTSFYAMTLSAAIPPPEDCKGDNYHWELIVQAESVKDYDKRVKFNCGTYQKKMTWLKVLKVLQGPTEKLPKRIQRHFRDYEYRKGKNACDGGPTDFEFHQGKYYRLKLHKDKETGFPKFCNIYIQRSATKEEAQ